MREESQKKPFDNTVSKITGPPPICPKCEHGLRFMYARSRTEDEVWFCPGDEIIFTVKITTTCNVNILKKLDE